MDGVDEPCSPTPPTGASAPSGHLMCYEGRTSSRALDRPERARRLEVFTGAGRRRNWPADEKAAIVAESYAPGRTVCGVARRHGLTPAQLSPGPRLARRSRWSVQEPPVRFVPAVVEAVP